MEILWYKVKKNNEENIHHSKSYCKNSNIFLKVLYTIYVRVYTF